MFIERHYLTRRALLQQITLAGAACAFTPALAASGADHTQDWKWLEGN